MSQRIMRLTYNGNNDRRFADPNSFSRTLRVTLALTPKKAGDATVTNARSEFISNDIITVAGGCTDPCSAVARQEKVSVRTVISGSVENHAAMLQMVKDHHRNVEQALEDQLAGFMSQNNELFVVDYGVL